MTRWEHLLVISLIGVGALDLINQGDRVNGITLLLMLAGYVFGVTANGVANNRGTSASKQTVASNVSSTSHSNDSTDSNSSQVLTLADEAYEDDEFHG